MSIANPTEDEKHAIERRVAVEIYKETSAILRLSRPPLRASVGLVKDIIKIQKTVDKLLSNGNYGILGGIGVQVAAQLKSIRENFDAETVAAQVASVLNQFQC